MGRFEEIPDDQPPAAPAPAAPAAPRFQEVDEGEDKVAPYGLSGVITGERKPSALERAKSMLMGGLNAGANMVTNAADAATMGYYSKARNAVAGAVAPNDLAKTLESEQTFNENHPMLASTARAAGYFTPGGAPERLAEATGAGLKMATKAASPWVAKFLAARPVAGALTGAAVSGGQTAAEDVTAGVPIGEAAKDAGKAALVGAGIGAAAGTAGSAASKLIKNARGYAVQDIGNDIIAAEGPRARATDQKRIAEVNDRLYELTREKPELRSVWRESAEKALPKIAEAKRAAAEPLDGLYKAVDAKTGGGIRLGDVIQGFEKQAQEAGSMASGQPQADRLRAVAQNFIKAYGGELPPAPPAQTMALQQVRNGLAERIAGGRASPGSAADLASIDRQIAAAKGGPNMDAIIPTARFRQEVTNLHKTAEQAMGAIEGTAKHEALDELYRTGKQIIDQHLDASGIGDAQLAKLRKANDQYFLLSRAEAAIESRGWKEANRPTGLRMPRTVHGALHATLPMAVGYAAMNPHAIPEMLGAYALGHAAPAIASRANWALAGAAPGADAILARNILKLTQSGVPRATAIQMARAMGPAPPTPVPEQAPPPGAAP